MESRASRWMATEMRVRACVRACIRWSVGIRVVRKNILHSAKGKRRRTFSPTCPSIRRHGGRGEVGVAELTASVGAEESCGKQVEIRGVPAGVRPRFTLEDQGRSTTSSSKRRHHMVSGRNSSTIQAAAQPRAQQFRLSLYFVHFSAGNVEVAS